MKILILGAAGQISVMLTESLLKQTDADMVLYARHAKHRLQLTDAKREQVVEGDFHDIKKLTATMAGVDLVYINDMGDKTATTAIVSAMEASGIKRVIAASILGIYNEVDGAFGLWNQRMVGLRQTQKQAESAQVLEQSDLDYTLLRLTWLYNQSGNTAYTLTQKGEAFIGAQVTRQAVAKLIVDIINAPDQRFIRTSIGVSEPNTDWPKPSFY